MDKIAELLHEAAETHHVVYRIVDGDDRHLAQALVELDRDYVATSPSERWEDWYAQRLRERFSL